MAFRGWPSEALEFYEGLEADNSKTYWTAHKAVYEKQVHGPMADLLTDLEPEFGPGRIFRPYRDVRFSADKSPYKTAIAARLDRGGYLQLSARGLGAGCGMYMMEPAQLASYRAAVAATASGERLVRVVAELAKHKIEVHGREALRSAPKGYPKDHPRIDLLRNKGIVAWRDWPIAAWLGTAAARQRVAEFLRACRPLNDWLAENVGGSLDS
ncbi:MAG TPA: DUF2461 domain-containing protein [Rugosimonospora sp.]|nr:DUF2461 domain-containing protein [Rugosimonospora sp.]